jgi:cation transport regulator
MPFRSTRELPDPVKHVLPAHAQEIYKEAYNSAWEQYDTPAERREGRDREETAHAVAWSAVKNMYEKNEDTGKWRKKKE